MKKQPSRYSFLDLVATYCVANNTDTTLLAIGNFAEVTATLVETGQAHQRLLEASEDIHKYYEFCHFECHLKRLRNLQANNFVWPPGTGPHQEPHGADDNVYQFPPGTTKH